MRQKVTHVLFWSHDCFSDKYYTTTKEKAFLVSVRLTGLAQEVGSVYRQLKKVSLNLLSGVLEAHQSCLEIYKPASLPRVQRLCSWRVKGQRAAWSQAPGLQSPADASNFDAGPDQVGMSTRSSSGSLLGGLCDSVFSQYA